MKLYLSIFLVLFTMCSCKNVKKTDLSTLTLNESISSLYHQKDTAFIGVETMEYPYALILEVRNTNGYSYDGIDLQGNRVLFLINAESLKTDSITRFGGAHYDIAALAHNDEALQEKLTTYRADSTIYGLRIELKSLQQKSAILSNLKTKYGEGTKNPNTENGLYWNIKAENKFIFFAPDYDRLIILNSTHLSKSCYWDSFNGMIDLGGCDQENYLQSLTKNATKPEDVKDKPKLTIDENWSINGLLMGVSSEDDLQKSPLYSKFERMEEYDGATAALKQIYFQDKYHDVYFFLSPSKNNPENHKENILQGYSVTDFKKVNIVFDNELKPAMQWDDAIKLFDPKKILNYRDLNISNYLDIDHANYKITLTFDENKKFSAMYFMEKE